MLFCNVHLDPIGRDSPQESPAPPGSGRHQAGIWGMSSEIPPELLSAIFPSEKEEGDSSPSRRFYVYNANLPAFEKFLKFGTQTVLNTRVGVPGTEPKTVEVRVIGNIMPYPEYLVEKAKFEIVEEE